jgi:hypothetical protein
MCILDEEKIETIQRYEETEQPAHIVQMIKQDNGRYLGLDSNGQLWESVAAKGWVWCRIPTKFVQRIRPRRIA